MSDTVRAPGLVLTEHEFAVPLDHAAPTASASRSSRARSPIPTAATGRSCVYLQGGPGFEAPRPTRHPSAPGWLDRALRGLPRADARPARHRPLDAGRRAARPARPAEQAEYLAHFRADSIVRDAEWIRARARRRALERARPELRRLLRHDLPLARARGPARGVHHRRAAAGRRAAPTTSTGRTYERVLERTRRYYERYPDDRDAGARAAQPPRRRGRAAAVAATGSPAPRLRQLGQLLGHERRRRAAALHPRAAARLAGLPARRRERAGLRAATRSTRSSTRPATPTACATRWSAERLLPGGLSRRSRALHRRARLPVDVRGLRARSRRCARRPSSWPSASGRGCTTPSSCARNEVPAAAAIYAERPVRRARLLGGDGRARSAACGRG